MLVTKTCLKFDVSRSNVREKRQFLHQVEIPQEGGAVQPAYHKRYADEREKTKPPPGDGRSSLVRQGSE